MKITIEQEDYDRIRDVIYDACDIVPSNNDIDKIVGNNQSLFGEIFQNGYNDTLVREKIVSALSMFLINRRWATYGEGEDAYYMFITMLLVEAKNHGMEVKSK